MRVGRFAKQLFAHLFRKDRQTECRVTITTAGWIPALTGSRHLRPADRAEISSLLSQILKCAPARQRLTEGVDRGVAQLLRESSRADSNDSAYLFSYLKELLRQHADQNDLLECADIELSPVDLDTLRNSHLFSSTWRLLVPMFISREKLAAHLAHVYCFGCAQGDTVVALKWAFDARGMQLPFLNLFDSFAGLPAEQAGVATNSYWRVGSFASGPERLREKLRGIGVVDERFEIHEGFYCDSLTPERAASGILRPALYIDIDCDLYVSTYQALDFMFAHNLATLGTYIGYDDWGDTKEWTEGESRAHKEIAEKYGVWFRQCFSWGRAPVVRKLFRVLRRDSR